MTNQEFEKLKPHLDSIEYVVVFETKDENYEVTATDEKWTTQIENWLPDQLTEHTSPEQENCLSK